MNISKISVNTALSLGGNKGDVLSAFKMVRRAFESAGMTSIKTSSLYKTPPVGCLPGTPDFINAALSGVWHDSLEKLFTFTKELEISSGRPENHPRNSDRPLDIDIIFFGELQMRTASLTIPHLEAEKRLFVLLPLEEVAGSWIFPGKKLTVSEFLGSFRTSEDFRTLKASKLSENF